MFAEMTLAFCNQTLMDSLIPLYGGTEAAAINRMVMEKLTGQQKSAWMLRRQDAMNEADSLLFNHWLMELRTGRPVQYVLEEAWFHGLPFFVDESVLIPRPETEELVDWVLASMDKTPDPVLLDIGTGSGCIAVSIRKKNPAATVLACDISEAALIVARKNAADLGTDIQFVQTDILSSEAAQEFPPLRYIVSNPPYIPESEKQSLDAHVRLFEPPGALFVPDADPLIFYKKITAFGEKKLSSGGLLFFEIHEDYASALQTFFADRPFNVNIKKDIFGKSRMAQLEKL